MTAAAKLVRMPKAQKAAPGRTISPAMKSWIRNCIVPALVQEFLATRNANLFAMDERNKVIESGRNTATATRVQ